MKSRIIFGVITVGIFLGVQFAAAQDTSSAVCSFEDGKHISIQYHEAPAAKAPVGSVWAPGGSPMYLFTETPIEIAGKELALGAYSLFLVPAKEQWTLIVNQDVKSKSHDASKDLTKVPMQIAESPSDHPNMNVFLGRTGPKQCVMRVYNGKTAAFGAEFKEK